MPRVILSNRPIISEIALVDDWAANSFARTIRQFRGLWFDYLFASNKEVPAIVEKTGWTVAAIAESQSPGFVAILEKT